MPKHLTPEREEELFDEIVQAKGTWMAPPAPKDQSKDDKLMRMRVESDVLSTGHVALCDTCIKLGYSPELVSKIIQALPLVEGRALAQLAVHSIRLGNRIDSQTGVLYRVGPSDQRRDQEEETMTTTVAKRRTPRRSFLDLADDVTGENLSDDLDSALAPDNEEKTDPLEDDLRTPEETDELADAAEAASTKAVAETKQPRRRKSKKDDIPDRPPLTAMEEDHRDFKAKQLQMIDTLSAQISTVSELQTLILEITAALRAMREFQGGFAELLLAKVYGTRAHSIYEGMETAAAEVEASVRAELGLPPLADSTDSD